MDLIIRNARLAGRPSHELSDIGIERGRIVALERGLSPDAAIYDANGRLACPGLIETHIHLDKSRICLLIRIANLYANVLQVDRPAHLRECFDMLTHSSARLFNLKDQGFSVGNRADVVVIDAQTPEQAVAKISQPAAAFKNGKRTVEWNPPDLLRPK